MAIKKEQVNKAAAASYTTEPKKERKPKEKKAPISFYITPSNYEEMKRLAKYRGVSVGSLIDDTLAAYLDECHEEIQAYDEFAAKMKAKAAERAKKK
jgi:hypothetical protein